MNKQREHRDPRHPEWAVKAFVIVLAIGGVLMMIKGC